MGFNYSAACGCFIGNGRNNNEDNFYFNKKHLPEKNKGLKNAIKCHGNIDDTVLFAVFDGMGGELYGEKASFCASEVFSDEVKVLDEIAMSGKEFMLTTCQKANDAILRFAADKKAGSVGTTVASLLFYQEELFACNVGDSKIFRIRDNKMFQISEDHTDEKIMTAMGIKKKPVLLQYLGMPGKDMTLDPYVSKGDVLPGDIYFICSDGVTDVLGNDVLFEILSKFDPIDAVKQILGKVDILNGADNSTAIVVKIGKEE